MDEQKLNNALDRTKMDRDQKNNIFY